MKTFLPSNHYLKGPSLVFFCTLAFVQSAIGQQIFPQPKQCKVLRGTTLPSRTHHHANSTMKNMAQTSDVIDYSTYDELMANNLQITYNGSWNSATPQPEAQELTSFITPASASALLYSFAQVVFDSLAFANYTNASTYYLPRAGSSVTLDSVGMFIGIAGDTVMAHGTMEHDSLLISVYRVVGTTVSPTPVKTIVNAGYAGLKPFITGTTMGYLVYANVPVGQQFNTGEAFAVRVTYLNKDTSSHCYLALSFADSCGTITYQGGQYASPAYPSPFKHSSSCGVIDSTGINSASVMVVDNQYTYNLTGVATNCSYFYVQNWEILSYVTVNVQYAAQIQASQTTICGSSTVGLNAQVFGTDSAHITYHWAVSGGGNLISSNTQATSVTEPVNNTGNVTVSLTVNDGSGDVTDSLVLINCHLNVNAGNSQTVCTGSNIILTPSVTGGTPPYAYQWQASGSSLSCPTCANPSVTLSQNSVYTVTVTDAAQTTATSAISYTLNGFTNQVAPSATNTGISCSNMYDTTTVTVTGGATPYTINWGGGNISSGTSPQVYYYGLPGGVQIISVTDANSCVTQVFDTVVNAGPTVSLAQAIEPGCPNSATGEIIASVTGGTAPYSYNWGNGPGSDTIANITSGNYQLVVTDAHSCTAMLSYDLVSVRDYNYYVFITTANANCNLSGAVNVSVTGGVNPYNYQWNNGATTANIQPMIEGTYSLTITDSLGCQTYGSTYVSTYCHSMISGTAFFDSTGTCNLATGSPFPDLFIVATSSVGNSYYGFTDVNGNYSMQVTDTGTYPLTAEDYYFNMCGNLTFCGNGNQTVYLPVLGDSSNNNNISFTGASGYNLSIHPGWTSADPGFVKQYWVFYYNSSVTPYHGPATITFVYDSNLVYQSTDRTPAPVNNTSTHTLTWTVSSVPDINTGWMDLDGYFMVPASLSLNYLLQSDFKITPVTGDCDSSDNHYHYSETVIGSHDPNEKTVSPSGPVTASDSILTYTIHFQNTGTDSTHFVIIKDTLSPNLDPATVRNIASSDKYSSFNVSGKGILTWTFNPLRIVDSITNPSGSKRFIMFTVKKKPNLPIGTTISNTASIYFDYNDAVVTNTVADTEALPTYISPVSNSNNISVKAFPNPFSDITHIVVTGLNEKFGFELYDVTGRLQQSIPSVDNSQLVVHKGLLAKGAYLYRIIVAGKPAAYGKLMVE